MEVYIVIFYSFRFFDSRAINGHNSSDFINWIISRDNNFNKQIRNDFNVLYIIYR